MARPARTKPPSSCTGVAGPAAALLLLLLTALPAEAQKDQNLKKQLPVAPRPAAASDPGMKAKPAPAAVRSMKPPAPQPTQGPDRIGRTRPGTPRIKRVPWIWVQLLDEDIVPKGGGEVPNHFVQALLSDAASPGAWDVQGSIISDAVVRVNGARLDFAGRYYTLPGADREGRNSRIPNAAGVEYSVSVYIDGQTFSEHGPMPGKARVSPGGQSLVWRATEHDRVWVTHVPNFFERSNAGGGRPPNPSFSPTWQGAARSPFKFGPSVFPVPGAYVVTYCGGNDPNHASASFPGALPGSFLFVSVCNEHLVIFDPPCETVAVEMGPGRTNFADETTRGNLRRCKSGTVSGWP